MNVSATLNAFKLLVRPAVCLPHATISTFNDLPIPISDAFQSFTRGQQPDIKAVVLDKDDCFAVPNENVVHKPYRHKFHALRKAYPNSRLLIVSNSAGTYGDPRSREAKLLEEATGVKVLRHRTKKPGCGAQIFDHFRNEPGTGVTRRSQIAIVGDRLTTDIVMANLNGFWGLWVKDGVVAEKSFITRWENRLAAFFTKYGLVPPKP